MTRGRPAGAAGGAGGVLLTALELAAIAYLAAVGGLLWWSNAPVLVGWQPRVVLTGSMLPTIQPGDVAIVGPGDPRDGGLPPGRIVLVDDPSRESGSYLHRVVRYEDDGSLVTKGDANSTEDHPSVVPDRVRGQLRLLVPLVGRPVIWVHEGRFGPVAGILAATWLAMAVALSLRRRGDDGADADEPADEAARARAAAAVRLGRGRAGAAAPGAGVTLLPGQPFAPVPDAPAPVEPPVPVSLPAAAVRPVAVELPADVALPPVQQPTARRVLPESAERLVHDLAAFEAAFGAGFGADDGDDVRGFDGRGFDL